MRAHRGHALRGGDSSAEHTRMRTARTAALPALGARQGSGAGLRPHTRSPALLQPGGKAAPAWGSWGPVKGRLYRQQQEGARDVALLSTATGPLQRTQPPRNKANRPTKVAIFVEPSPFSHVSGMKNRFESLIKGLTQAGDEVMVFTPDSSPPEEFCGAKVVSVLGFKLPFYSSPTLLLSPGLSVRVLWHLCQVRPDVIHVSTPGLMVFAATLYAKLLRIPLVMSYHTHIPEYIPKYTWRGLVEPMWSIIRWCTRRSDLTLVTSKAMKDELIKNMCRVKSIDVWQRGVDTEVFHPRFRSAEMKTRMTDGHPEAPLLLYVGRLGAEKNLSIIKGIMELLFPPRHKMQSLLAHSQGHLPLLRPVGTAKAPLVPSAPLHHPHVSTRLDRLVPDRASSVVARVSAETKEAKREAKKEAKKKKKSSSPSPTPEAAAQQNGGAQAQQAANGQEQSQQQQQQQPGEVPPPSGLEVLDDSGESSRGTAGSSGISSGVRLQNIAVTFKNQQVLTDCSWEVKKGERVGLIGVNGSGKTTQLQAILGKVQPDSGEIIKAKRNMRIAYLAQEFDVDPRRTVREEFYQVYDQQVRAVKRQEQLSAQLESAGEDMTRMQAILDELDKLNNKVLDMDVELLDKKIDQMMPELGFKQEDNDRLVASYSGGWQMRMCLGKMLLQEPDLLLLDEPTNHLDLDAVEWLEQYLKQQEVPMVVVSHDREFMDQVCTKIVETERGVSTTYNGNYTQFVAAKNERIALQWVAWEKQQKEIEKQREIIQRLSGGSQSGRAGQAQKVLDRIKEEGLVPKPFVPKKRGYTFPPVEKMGQRVVSIENLTHGYNDHMLFKDVSLEIERGDRVAIIGPNGSGKSTLLRMIMGQEKPQQGSVRLGEHNIVPNYFEQNQAEALDPNLTVLDTLIQSAPDAKLSDLKNLLGRMLFTGQAVEKKVGVLSGGEKARLALAKFMCTKGTLLILDEPTNHLDIPSKETLEEAVQNFEGSVIAASHDRYFLRQIATRILQAEDCKLIDYKGDYGYFLEQNEDEAVKMAAKAEKAKEIEKSTIKAKSKMTKAEKEKMKKEKAKEFHAAKGGKKK